MVFIYHILVNEFLIKKNIQFLKEKDLIMKTKNLLLLLCITVSLSAMDEVERETENLSCDEVFKIFAEEVSIERHAKELYNLLNETIIFGDEFDKMQSSCKFGDSNQSDRQIKEIIMQLFPKKYQVIFENNKGAEKIEKSLKQAITTEKEKLNLLSKLQTDRERFSQFKKWFIKNRKNQEMPDNLEEMTRQRFGELEALLDVVYQSKRDREKFIKNCVRFIQTGDYPFTETTRKAYNVFGKNEENDLNK
jgi:hypothetical protein